MDARKMLGGRLENLPKRKINFFSCPYLSHFRRIRVTAIRTNYEIFDFFYFFSDTWGCFEFSIAKFSDARAHSYEYRAPSEVEKEKVRIYPQRVVGIF